MREELEKKLVAAFPDYFRDYHGDPVATGMAWGCECGDGWFPIIWALCDSINGYQANYANNNEKIKFKFKWKHLRSPLDTIKRYLWVRKLNKTKSGLPVPPMFRFTQIKEKFGMIRVYYSCDDSNPIYENFISMAESLSSITCEDCGSTEEVYRSVGWIHVSCRKCLGEGFDPATRLPVLRNVYKHPVEAK